MLLCCYLDFLRVLGLSASCICKTVVFVNNQRNSSTQCTSLSHGDSREKFKLHRGKELFLTALNNTTERPTNINMVITHPDITFSPLLPPLTYFPHLFFLHFASSTPLPPSLPPSLGLLLPHLLSNASIFLPLFSTAGESCIWSSLNKDLQSSVVCVCALWLSAFSLCIKNLWHITSNISACCRTYKQIPGDIYYKESIKADISKQSVPD